MALFNIGTKKKNYEEMIPVTESIIFDPAKNEPAIQDRNWEEINSLNLENLELRERWLSLNDQMDYVMSTNITNLITTTSIEDDLSEDWEDRYGYNSNGYCTGKYKPKVVIENNEVSLFIPCPTEEQLKNFYRNKFKLENIPYQICKIGVNDGCCYIPLKEVLKVRYGYSDEDISQICGRLKRYIQKKNNNTKNKNKGGN